MTANFKYSSLAFLLVILFIPSLLFGQKDHFKAFLKAPGHDNPTRIRGNKIILGNNGKDLYIVGELKAADPDYSNQAFVIHSDAEGTIKETFNLKSVTQSASDGLRGSSLVFDAEGGLYIGGSYTGSWNPLSMGSERTLVKLDEGGKQEWGAMQPNLYFSDLTYSEITNHITAISGPSNLLNPNYDIHFSEYTTDGKIFSTFTLQTNTVDYGRAILHTPDGIAFTGTAYDSGIPHALVGLVDTDLNLTWAFSLSNNDFELKVADMAYHPEGILGISGTARDTKNNITQAFLTGIGLNGEVYFFKTYQIGTETQGLGVKEFSQNNDKGFLMTGFYHTGNPAERKSMVLKTDLDGILGWANNYSPYKPEDNTYDEVLRDITYMESEGLFAAVGDIRRYKNGQNIDRRSLVLVKGAIEDGELNLGEACYQVLQADTHSRILTKQSVGTGNTLIEGFTDITYQQASLEFNTGYCSFGPAPKTEEYIPGRLSLLRGVYLDKEQFRILQTGPQNLRIEYGEKAFQKSVSVEIFDLMGKNIRTVTLSPNRQQWEIQLPQLSYGMYFVKIATDNLPLKVERFIMGE